MHQFFLGALDHEIVSFYEKFSTNLKKKPAFGMKF